MTTGKDLPSSTAQGEQDPRSRINMLRRRATLSQQDSIQEKMDSGMPLENILTEILTWGIPEGKPARATVLKTGRWCKRRGLRSLILNKSSKYLPSLPDELPPLFETDKAFCPAKRQKGH